MSSSDSERNRNGGSKPPAPPAAAESGTGIIRDFVAEKGFGFIAYQDEPDLFFHVSDLVDNDIAVEIGQKVCFELEPSVREPGTFVAVRVQRYGDE